MPKFTLDGMEYNTEDLSDSGKATLSALQFIESQLQKLNSERTVFMTAHTHLSASIREELNKL